MAKNMRSKLKASGGKFDGKTWTVKATGSKLGLRGNRIFVLHAKMPAGLVVTAETVRRLEKSGAPESAEIARELLEARSHSKHSRIISLRG